MNVNTSPHHMKFNCFWSYLLLESENNNNNNKTNVTTPSAAEDVERAGPRSLLVGTATSENYLVVSSKVKYTITTYDSSPTLYLPK